jgi:hypothetical protein
MDPAATELTARAQLIASPDALERIGARLEDLSDPDMRALAIRADHPELEQALDEGLDEVTINGQPISIRLHLAMHEIIANQLTDGEPPEVLETATRLLSAGYDRHEIIHMLAAPLAEQIFATVARSAAFDRERHLAALAALPESWERQRPQRTVDRVDPHRQHPARRRR